jgi:hypothetical protein
MAQRELDHRANDGIDVTLLWKDVTAGVRRDGARAA